MDVHGNEVLYRIENTFDGVLVGSATVNEGELFDIFGEETAWEAIERVRNHMVYSSSETDEHTGQVYREFIYLAP